VKNGSQRFSSGSETRAGVEHYRDFRTATQSLQIYILSGLRAKRVLTFSENLGSDVTNFLNAPFAESDAKGSKGIRVRGKVQSGVLAVHADD
jgi:hypothetical protein